MATVPEGGTDPLVVQATNKGGRVVALPADTTVAVGMPSDSVSALDPATGAFVFTAGSVDGTDNLVASSASAGLTSDPYPETVVADNTPAKLTIKAASSP